MDKSGVKIETYWAKLMAKSLNSRNVADLLTCGGNNSSSTVTTTVTQQPTENKQKQQEVKKEEPKPEEEDMDMGGLFDWPIFNQFITII